MVIIGDDNDATLPLPLPVPLLTITRDDADVADDDGRVAYNELSMPADGKI